MADDDEDLEHPALKNFNEGIYTAKHVAGKTLKSGLIGAAIGGVGVAAAVTAFAAFTPVGWITTAGLLVGEWTGLTAVGVTSVLGGAATAGVAAGGGAGAVVGLATGASSADEAVEKRKEEIVAQAERMEVRKERIEAVKMQKIQQDAMSQAQMERQMGMVPQQGLPQKPVPGQQL